MNIKVQESAKKDLKKIDKSEAIKILKAIEKLRKYPNTPNIKKLTNFHPPFRFRVGNYRVLFDIEDDVIIVFNIKHRSKAYE